MRNIENHIDEVRELCKLYNVVKMYLFGSVLGKEFTEQSDVDFLVKFKEIDLAIYFENYINFKTNLASLLGRDVDLLEEQTLKNPILIRNIHKSKELIYG